jgi:hypothetical protein
MPYIKQGVRDQLDAGLREPVNSGELNYVITRLCARYLGGIGFSYTQVNDVVGALECAKLELYRRMAAPYEDYKKKQNGDVY